MTVAELLEQARSLSAAEKKELVKGLIDLMEVTEPDSGYQKQGYWGQSLNQLLDEIGPIEMKYPDIEDPVAWVKQLRADELKRRLGDWGETE